MYFSYDTQTYWDYRVDGKVFVSFSGKNSAKMRKYERRFSEESEAHEHARKTKDKKIKQNFFYFNRNASKGEIIFQMEVPDNSVSMFFDLHPNQDIIAVGTIKEEAMGAALYLVHFSTGKMEKLKDISRGVYQSFIHSVYFNYSGTKIIYSVNEETIIYDLESGTEETLAKYFINPQQRLSNFNPHCVRPHQSKDRKKLLYFAENDEVRVCDETFTTILTINTFSETTECRYAQLSPSGKYLALYIASRYVIYRHKDAEGDRTNYVEIWDVETQNKIQTIVFGSKLEKVGISPDDQSLIYTKEFAQGPAIYSLKEEDTTYHFADDYRKDRWDVCFGWNFSRSGAIWSIGRFSLDLRDFATKEKIPTESFAEGRLYKTVFSSDGSIVVSGGDRGSICIRKIY